MYEFRISSAHDLQARATILVPCLAKVGLGLGGRRMLDDHRRELLADILRAHDSLSPEQMGRMVGGLALGLGGRGMSDDHREELLASIRASLPAALVERLVAVP